MASPLPLARIIALYIAAALLGASVAVCIVLVRSPHVLGTTPSEPAIPVMRRSRQDRAVVHGPHLPLPKHVNAALDRTEAVATFKEHLPLQRDEVATPLFGICIMVSRKSLHYRHLAESLERSDLSRFTPVFVSHDRADDTMLDITKALKQRFPRLEHKLHPHRCELVELNASQFPRYSTDGVEQPHWRYTCAKHHWLWAFSQAWKRVPQSIEHMLYLEEDFAVAKHVGQLLRQLIAAADSSPHHLGTMLQCRDNLWTVSGTLKRAAWYQLLKARGWYCVFNEYNWDLTAKQTWIQLGSRASNEYICSRDVDLAVHLGVHGTGMTFGDGNTDADQLEAAINASRRTFHAATDHVVSLHDAQMCSGYLHEPHPGLGGYASPIFHQHCRHLLDDAYGVAADVKPFEDGGLHELAEPAMCTACKRCPKH